MTDRERLVQALRKGLNDGWQHEAERLADIVLKETAAPPPPKVWPGLEESETAYATAYMQCPDGPKEGRRAGLAAAAPVLWRAMVNALPGLEPNVAIPPYWRLPRAALLAIADPYDGGGK